jgi:pyruvate/2-oxoglutarate dehydrogenase complex dihydrolipoamide dehydrogenase (E3) component
MYMNRRFPRKENVRMAQATHYDAIVIGSSRGGRLLPIALAKAGRKVALIERSLVGGTCINVGCTPTKTMVASARLASLARRGAEYGVHTGHIAVDLQAIHKRKQGIIEGARLALESRLEATQRLDLLRDEAHFIAAKTLEVYLKDGETRELTSPLIFIDTGNRPEPLAIKGVESVPVLNSTTIMELDTLPEHLFVIGSGYVGLEFAQMFRLYWLLGSSVQKQARRDGERSPSPACKHRRVGGQSDVVTGLLMLEQRYSHVMEKFLLWVMFFPLSSG